MLPCCVLAAFLCAFLKISETCFSFCCLFLWPCETLCNEVCVFLQCYKRKADLCSKPFQFRIKLLQMNWKISICECSCPGFRYRICVRRPKMSLLLTVDALKWFHPWFHCGEKFWRHVCSTVLWWSVLTVISSHFVDSVIFPWFWCFSFGWAPFSVSVYPATLSVSALRMGGALIGSGKLFNTKSCQN